MPNRRCWLKTGELTKIVKQGAVSGGRDCEGEDANDKNALIINENDPLSIACFAVQEDILFRFDLEDWRIFV